MPGKQVDLLIPQLGYSERDSIVLYDVLYYLDKLGYTYKVVPHFDLLSFFRYRPRVLFQIDAHGGIYNVLFAKYAKKNGILVVSLSSESNQMPNKIEKGFWGHNNKKIPYQDLRFVWNSYIKDNMIPKLKDYPGRIEVSGAIGFDKYSFMKFMSKEEFLKKYDKKGFKKVITYAAANFGKFVDLLKDPSSYPIPFDPKEVKKRVDDMELVRSILENLIKNNPDILFILKKHPGKMKENMEILNEWAEFPNVLIMQYEENVYNLLNVSDIWFSYESMTAVEAWIMGLPSFQIMSMPKGFERFHKNDLNGNLLIDNYEKVQKNIDEFFSSGKIKDYDSKKKFRDDYLKMKAEHIDGLNGYRTVKMIDDFLKESKYKRYRFRFNIFQYINAFIFSNMHYLLLKMRFLKKYDFFRQRYNTIPSINKRKMKYFEMIDDFVKSKNINIGAEQRK